jgi:hypothetical protein
MIPTLLWRCPLCSTHDALVHVERRFRADRVYCRYCWAEWRLRRAPGDNFYLKLVGQACPECSRRDGGLPQKHDERSITAWYDLMKATLRLEPLQDPAVALEPGEMLYLASGPAELIAEEGDPLFFPDAPGADTNRLDKRKVGGKLAGRGRLLLTNRRLIWQDEGLTRSWPLARLNSAYAFLNYGVMFLVEMRLYTVHFLEESLLKWVTYVALVAPLVEAETGHRIATSNF